VPVQLTKETEGKEILWQRSYSAYLIKLRKVNFGEFFTGLEPENQQSLVVSSFSEGLDEGQVEEAKVIS